MDAPDPATLPGLVRATYLAMTRGAPRAVPDPATRALLEQPLPADLRALVHAWTFHGRPSQSSLRTWDVYDAWDFAFSIAPVTEAEVRRVCGVLAPGSRTQFPPGPYVQLGTTAGGIVAFAGVDGGKTAVFGPEAGEDHGEVDDFLFAIYERSGFAREPALEPFVEPDFFADG